jgi:shikimate kinase
MKLKIFLIGFMGSGKTHWGRVWARKNQLNFFDLDEQIEKTLGETIADIFEKKGEENFREMERYVLRKFDVKNNFVLACGGGTPCFMDNLQWMNEQGTTVYLQASPSEILEKVMNETQERPLLKKLNSSELLFFIEQKLKEREPYYKRAKYTLDANTLTATSLSGILKNKTPDQ